ncbi:ABC transporter permease [Halosegnis rubeus]|jgi:ABC-2 type transport system permease protein|uniref:ABC transporter permease n=1 Tax=Halosegnis rubeus TaxID=2212850 RepID=A0A5N5UBS9_9EURY|nr:ABC transporter permease [Halosegnis rubeus]KAB7516043.1 ABC transporter permease [Halosegnis rubeus]KAB7516743.1 ABC transporter permease [Halosegnis rubeus]KAB7520126.1 ABC transporter permease [Halosegnis rubeus]
MSNGFLWDVWVNFKRWNLKAVRNPFVLVVSLAQPIIFLVLFTQVFGGVATGAINRGGGSITYETYLVPAIAIQVALAAAVTSGIGLVEDIEEGIFEKILASPMHRGGVFLGKATAELLRIAVQIGIILVLGTLLGASIAGGIPSALAIIGIGVVFSLWFMGLSNVIALVTRDQESTIIASNVMQFPLLFLSTGFLPLDALPGWVQTVAKYNPVTYGIDAARAVMLGRDTMTVIEVTQFTGVWNTLVPALAILTVLDLAFGAAAVYLIGRASSSSVS